MIDMVPIFTDNIDSLGYDNLAKCLHIKFTDKEEYCYKNVNMETFIELLYSKTKNEYFQEHIVDRYEAVAV